MAKIFAIALTLYLLYAGIADAQTHTFCPTDGGGSGVCSFTATQDFSNVTLMKARVSAALTSSVNGDFGYDSANNNWHFWNGADSIIAPILASSLPSNGQIVKYTVSGSKITESGIGPQHGIMNSVFCSPSSGSGTAYTCSTSPTFTPTDGDLLDFDADVTNTGSITLNVNGTGAVAVQKWFGCSGVPPCNLVSGDIKANQPTWLYLDTGLNIWSEMSPVSQLACSGLSNAAASCSTDATNAANISSGTLAAARGGAGTTTGALKGNGSGVVSQAACADLSNAAPSCSTDTTNASNISSGTVAAARGGAGTVNGALKGNGSGAVSQAACGDLSNAVASCSTDTTNAANISSGSLALARVAQGGATNNQCLQWNGSAWTPASCSGTSGMQLIGAPNDSLVSVFANTTSNQALQAGCASTPCYGAGALNSINKTIDYEGWGTFTSVNTTETISFSLNIGANNTSTMGSLVPTTTNPYSWYLRVVCYVRSTGSSGQMRCTSSGSALSGSSTFLFAVSSSLITVDLTTALSPTLNISFTTASTSNLAQALPAFTHQWN